MEQYPSPPQPLSDMPLTVIVEGGDVILDCSANDSRKRFLVASQVLWVSPVFRRMLGPESRFLEAVTKRENDGKATTISLDTDPNVFELVLKAIHLCNDEVPLEIEFELLVSVAEVADKYELQKALRMVVELWLHDFVAKKAGGYPLSLVTKLGNPGDWVLIAWVFSYGDLFFAATREVIMSWQWIPDVGLGTRQDNDDYVLCMSEAVPEAVTSLMAASRKFSADRLYDHLMELSKTLRQPRGATILCKDSTPEKACDLLQLGIAIRTIDQYGFENDPGGRNRCLRIVSDEFQTIEQVNYETYNNDNYNYNYNNYNEKSIHTNCSWVPEFKRFVQRSIDEIQGLQFRDFPSRMGQPTYDMPGSI